MSGCDIASVPSDECDHETVHARADELRDLLNDWDFIGVFDPETNVDEYDCMINPLLRNLIAGAGSSEIRQLLDVEIIGHFGMSAAQAETRLMAERLTAWWQAGLS